MLHLMGQKYGQRPSSILGVDDEWAAYQFDRACMTLASKVSEARRLKMPVSSVLASPQKKGGLEQAEFRPPPMPTKRVKIPETGVW